MGFVRRRKRPGTASIPGRLLATALLAGVLACEPAPQPDRVVSLSAAASEVLVGIGAGDVLVAVDEGSRGLAGLGDLPVATLATAGGFSPDLLLVPPLGAGPAPLAERLRTEGTEVIEFAPHDFDDAFHLCRVLGRRLGRPDRARAFVRERSSELARISSSSTGQRRPRVAVLLELDPLVIAGGHSFATDLVEIAGAENVTHGTHQPRIPMGAAEVLALRPELVLVVGTREVPEPEREALRTKLGTASRVAFVHFDPERIWLGDPVAVAREIHALVRSARGEQPDSGPRSP